MLPKLENLEKSGARLKPSAERPKTKYLRTPDLSLKLVLDRSKTVNEAFKDTTENLDITRD